jgi:curved DNA-binding protein
MGDHSNFFESLLSRHGATTGEAAGRWAGTVGQHATIQFSGRRYLGATARWSCGCRFNRGDGSARVQTRRFVIPKGIRAGRHIRLAGQGPGTGRGHAGTCTLDVQVDRARSQRTRPALDVCGLPVTPWEAALGAEVNPTHQPGRVNVPAGSAAGRKLRKGAQSARHQVETGCQVILLHAAHPRAR